MNTLIVDDEPLARRELKRLLAPFSWLHVVGEAADIDEAHERIVALHPALIFLDVQMPGTNGLTLQAELAKSGPGIPVIIMTALGSEATRDTAIRQGAVAYIEKPIRVEALLKAVRQATEH